jgi:beta-N-acetylhexosaminidase
VAGADLLCLGPDKDVALVRGVQRAIVEAVASGELSAERLAGAAARVDRLGARDGASTSQPEPPAVLRARQYDGARAALRVEGVLPDLHEAIVVSIATEPNIAVGAVPWGVPADLTVTPDASLPPGHEPLVVQVREAHRHPEVLRLLGSVVERPLALLEWGWPGSLPQPLDGVPRIVAFGSSQPSVAVVAELLHGAGWVGPS